MPRYDEVRQKKGRLLVFVAVAGSVAVAACTGGHDTPSASTTGLAAADSGLLVGDAHAPMPAPGTCHLGQRDGQPLPDPGCTPGAINPQVNQVNIADTICKSGWTTTVRPPVSITSKMKGESARSYGLGPEETGEYDYLVALTLGGAPDDPRNLWVQPGAIPNPKDAVEDRLNVAVCSGLIPLATAQKAITANWVTAFDDAGLRDGDGKVCLRDQPTKCATDRQSDSG